MIGHQSLAILATISSLVSARPGNWGGSKGSGGGGWGSYGNGGSAGSGTGEVCTTSTYAIPTVVEVPYTSTETCSYTYTSSYTNYNTYTTESTVNAGAVVTETQTVTETTTIYAPTSSAYVSCITSYSTWNNSVESTYLEYNTIVTTGAPVVTQVVGTSSEVGATTVPTYSYSTCVYTSTVSTSIPASTVVCSNTGGGTPPTYRGGYGSGGSGVWAKGDDDGSGSAWTL